MKNKPARPKYKIVANDWMTNNLIISMPDSMSKSDADKATAKLKDKIISHIIKRNEHG
tara:strand:- start:1424 stop:1597 length:174 start_codon:yes stop_codon:yes gene_type:complete